LTGGYARFAEAGRPTAERDEVWLCGALLWMERAIAALRNEVRVTRRATRILENAADEVRRSNIEILRRGQVMLPREPWDRTRLLEILYDMMERVQDHHDSRAGWICGTLSSLERIYDEIERTFPDRPAPPGYHHITSISTLVVGHFCTATSDFVDHLDRRLLIARDSCIILLAHEEMLDETSA